MTDDVFVEVEAAQREAYLVEPFIAGAEATCAVLEQADGSLIALPPIEIVPAGWSGCSSIKSVAGSPPCRWICDSTACRSEGNAPASIRIARRWPVGR